MAAAGVVMGGSVPEADVSMKGLAPADDVDSAKTTATIGIVVGAIGVLTAAVAIGLSRRRAST